MNAANVEGLRMKIYIHILYSEVYFKYWNIEISNSIPFSWQPQYINQNTTANFGNEKQMLELLEAIQSLLWPPSALLDQIFSIYHNLQLTRATHIIICQFSMLNHALNINSKSLNEDLDALPLASLLL